jgi:hypothetical protein
MTRQSWWKMKGDAMNSPAHSATERQGDRVELHRDLRAEDRDVLLPRAAQRDLEPVVDVARPVEAPAEREHERDRRVAHAVAQLADVLHEGHPPGVELGVLLGHYEPLATVPSAGRTSCASLSS